MLSVFELALLVATADRHIAALLIESALLVVAWVSLAAGAVGYYLDRTSR